MNVIPCVLTGYFFYGLYVNFMVGPVMTKKTRILLWITLLGAVTSITTNLTLVPHIGILGAGWAVALSYGAMALALFCFTQKNYAIPYEYKKLAVIAAACVASAAIVYGAGKHSIQGVLFIKIALLTIYPLWMWLTVRKA